MSQALNGTIAANTIHHWLRAWYAGHVPEAVDLDVVRGMLPKSPLAADVAEVRPPMRFNDDGFEGMLAQDPGDPKVWGIAYNGSVSPERQRFTIAHELGHLVLHRNQKQRFNCDKESVYAGHETLRLIEREADDFASNLLMPGDRLRDWISNRHIDLHALSAIAQRFQVSFEALCIRFVKFTPERAILVYWDNGYAKYEWLSSSARRTRARIRRTDDPQEPLPGTLAADPSVEQEWNGVEMSAALWCPEEAPYMKLREFKHSYGARDRVLTLLMLEGAEPRPWDQSWQDGESFDSYDQFVSNGPMPTR